MTHMANFLMDMTRVTFCNLAMYQLISISLHQSAIVAEWLWRVTQDLSSSRAMRAHSHVERREGSNPSDSIILF
jgi:hypothetical protein